MARSEMARIEKERNVDVDKVLFVLLALVIFPAVGFGLSKIAGGLVRGIRPPQNPPGIKRGEEYESNTK
jgi:hypothetical protein